MRPDSGATDLSPPRAQPRIDYAPPLPWRRRRRVRRAVVLLLLGLVVVACSLWGRPLYERGWVRFRRHQCLTFTRPPDFVAFETDPASAALLAKRPNYAALPYNGCAAPPAAVFTGPPDTAPFNLPQYGPPSPVAWLFLHRRRWPGGPERLVTVYLEAADLATPWGVKNPDLRFAANSWRDDSGPDSLGFTLQTESVMYAGGDLRRVSCGFFPGAGRRDLRFFFGQPDPADESHFTIGYEMGGRRGTIDGYLRGPAPLPANDVRRGRGQTMEGELVELLVRDGPAKLPPTPPPTAPGVGFGRSLPGSASDLSIDYTVALVEATAKGTCLPLPPSGPWDSRNPLCLLQVTHVYWGPERLNGTTFLYEPDLGMGGGTGSHGERVVGIDYLPTGTKGIWAIAQHPPRNDSGAGVIVSDPAPEARDTPDETGGSAGPTADAPRPGWPVDAIPLFEDVPALEWDQQAFAAVRELARAIEQFRATPRARAGDYLKDKAVHGSPDVSAWAVRVLGELPREQTDAFFAQVVRDGSLPSFRARGELELIYTDRRRRTPPGEPDPDAHDCAALLRKNLKLPLSAQDRLWLLYHRGRFDRTARSVIEDLEAPAPRVPSAAPATPSP